MSKYHTTVRMFGKCYLPVKPPKQARYLDITVLGVFLSKRNFTSGNLHKRDERPSEILKTPPSPHTPLRQGNPYTVAELVISGGMAQVACHS